ncbi:type VI secretion system baseplate subunit TssG, partial [Vibrio sp. OPT46]
MSAEQFYRELKQHPLFEAIHLIEHEVLQAEAQIGTDALPKHEKLNLKVNPSLGFENAQLCELKNIDDSKLEIETNLIGLTGEQGVLPQHYSELALHRQKEGDTAMVDFYDIFNHRLLSLYYRCWQLSQLTVQSRAHAQGARSPLESCKSALTGKGSSLSRHYGGVFASPVRSKGGL